MRAACFAPSKNRIGINPATSRPWADATGAFQPEARRFARLHGDGVSVYLFNPEADALTRQRQVREALHIHPDLDAVAMFCHGSKLGLQAGYHGRAGAEQLALDLARHRSLRTVVLYCCDTGRDADAQREDDVSDGPGGDGGFADLLRDELAQTYARSVTVFAHPATGHTTHLPYVRRFHHSTGAGGEWIVSPASALFASWRRRMLDRDDDLRFRFPFLAPDEVEREVRGDAQVT